MLFLAAPATRLLAQRQMEQLGRGLVVLHSATSQAYLSWRLLANDPAEVGFNVYRSANGGALVKLNTAPITNTTDYLDTTATFTVTNYWLVKPVTNGVEGAASGSRGLPANPAVRQYLSIPLVAPGINTPYDVKFCWIGDFDGDGEYDYLVDRLSTTGGVNQFLQAYQRDGKFLWQMDMGFNSTNTANAYEPDAAAICVGDKDNVTVYDLDGDGRAEVIVRAANGSVLPDGTVITTNNNTAQFLCILDGLTGAELARAVIPNPYFADGPLNCHAGVLYLDGVHPSIVFSGENRVGSGAFQRLTVAWDYRAGKLTQRWLYQTPAGQNDSEGHQLRVADANHDGKDDLIRIGGVVSESNGVPVTLYSTELQHGDRYHVTDIDPDRPGLEMYAIQQLNGTLLATALQDLGSGTLFKKWYSGVITDVGRGDVLDMDTRYRGMEVFSTQPGVFDCKGNQIGATAPWPTLGLWWDADNQREMLSAADGNGYNPVINKWSYSSSSAGRMYSVYTEGVHTAYGGRPAMMGDIFGDWREEFVVVANTYTELRIYTTKIQATNRLYCLMQNPQYRTQCTFKGYYQASYTDYYLGEQMAPPQPPSQVNAQLVWRGAAGGVWNTSAANWFTNWTVVGNANTNAAAFFTGSSVLFDLTGSNQTAIALSGLLTPGDVTVYAPKDYLFNGSTGSLSGAMKLTKAGAGRLTLTGTNTFTGGTTVWEGPLIVNGSLSASPVTVRGGVWLDGAIGGNGLIAQGATVYRGGNVSPGNGTNAAGTLTVSNGLTLVDGAFCRFDLSDDPTGAVRTNDLLNVLGNLTVSGTNHLVINRLNTNLLAGSVYPLINYSGALTGSLSNFDVQGVTGIPVALTNPPGQIALVVKSFRSPATVAWTGGQGGNAWDLLVSSNWLNGVTKDQFAPNDSVRFDDRGTSNLTVTLVGDLSCASLVVDSTGNYQFAGSGALIGTTGLLKTNTGTLTINAANNTFTGPTTVAGGTLVVAKLDAVGYASPLGNPPGGSTNLILAGGTLRITGESYTDRGLTLNVGTNSLEVTNSTDQVTIAGIVAGAGALQKTGAGTLGLTAANTYSGGTLIRGGNISLGGGTANQYALGTGAVTLDNGTLTMFSDSGSYDTCYWNLIVPAGSTGTLYADDRCNLYGTLTGGGTLNFNVYYVRTELDGNWSAFTGQINVGTDSAGGDFRMGNTYGYANAGVYLADHVSAYHISGKAVAFGALGGGPLAYVSGSAWTVGAKNSDATFAGTIASASVTKVGTGSWTLTGANTYAGTTTVSTGTLLVNGDDSACAGAVTVGSTATLGGNGTLGGATTVSGKLAPGSNGMGRLTFTNSLTLASGSTTLIELNRTNSPVCDQLLVGNLLAHGGTLSVTNLGGGLVAGDTFQIFTAATRSGTFAAVQLPPLGVNLAWDASALYTAGILSVVVSNSQTGERDLVWRGDGGANAWDVNLTANWRDTNQAASYFGANDRVAFTDAGSNNVPVWLVTNVLPGAWLVNASRDYIFAGAGVAGTNALIKAGTGRLTLANSNNLYSGGTIISNGTLRVATTGLGLAHRWSFNNSLADFVGGGAAAIVEVGTSNATLTTSNVTLAGGAWASADYVSLGAGLLPTNGTPVTIELWATPNAIQNWSRIFDFGASTAENLLMSWTMGTTLASDRVEWKDAVTSTADNSNQPYALGVEFHIVMVIEPGAGANGTTRVTWYRAAATSAAIGTARGTFNSTNTLAAFAATNCWLGRSEYSSDNTASASYDEVRIWHRALATNELQALHAAGPDAILDGLNLGRSASGLPSTTAVNLAGDAAVLENISGQPLAIGSLAGVAGSEVRLTAGALVTGGDNTSTTFAGGISGTNGVLKLGTGTWVTTGLNPFTGGAVLSNGIWLINGSLAGSGITAAGGTLGGNGLIAGAVTVGAGATLAPGSDGIGALTFNTTLALAVGSTNLFELDRASLTNDAVRIMGALTNGGTLIVTNLAGTLAVGDSFQLFNAASYHGTFGDLVLPALPASLVWNTNALNTSGWLAIAAINPPVIATLAVSNGSLIFSGTGGVANASYYLVAATNLTTPLSNWQLVLTNQFDATGAFNVTNKLDVSGQQFFRLLVR